MPRRDRANASSIFRRAPEPSGANAAYARGFFRAGPDPDLAAEVAVLVAAERQIAEYRVDGATGSARPLAFVLPVTIVGFMVVALMAARFGPFAPTGPTTTPAPVATRQVEASSQTADGDPTQAIDGNERTSWNAGGHAPAWIELELGVEGPVSAIRLLVEQTPAGPTVHHVFVAADDGGYEHVHTFEGVTQSGQWLAFTPEVPMENVRAVVIQTVDSPSWVAWREVVILRP